VKKKVLTLLIACVLFYSNMYSSGFQINESGARAMAMAGAFTGLANDPSAIYFNPAGITQLDGTQFYAGATMIMPIQSFKGPSPSTAEADMNKQTFFPINFYVTHKITERFSVGLGINNQYGLGTKWDQTWAGSHLAVETSVKTFFFTPVVAYKVLDNLSISVGATIATGNVKISTMNSGAITGYPDFLLTLDSKTTTSVGYTAGILYKPIDKLQIGVSYRSKSKFDFTGTATSNPATFYHPLLKANLPYPTGDISAPLTTPPNLTVGVAIFACDKWTITADYQWVGWSSYNNLTITFNNYPYDIDSNTPGVQNSKTIPRNYQDSYILRLGSEYKLNDVFALRAGVFYDNHSVPDNYVEPELPDANRIGLNVGAGYNFTDKLRVDLSYLILLFPDRTVTNSAFGFNGTYSNMIHLIGIDVSYNL